MIENDEQLALTVEQLGRMYRVLAELQRRIKPQSEQWYAIMAEGPLDMITQLKSEIEAYTGEAKVRELLAASTEDRG